MNKSRRKEIKDITEQLNEILLSVRCVADDESFAFENLPESLQCSLRGEQMEENIDDLEEVVSSIEECVNILENIICR